MKVNSVSTAKPNVIIRGKQPKPKNIGATGSILATMVSTSDRPFIGVMAGAILAPALCKLVKGSETTPSEKDSAANENKEENINQP